MYLSPDFSPDILISYSQGDSDQTGQSPLKAWSQQFARAFESELRQDVEFANVEMLLDESARVETALDPTLPLTQQRRTTVQGAGLIVILMSPHYLRSAWCRDEREWWFAHHGQQADVHGRVFVVRIWPTAESEWPDALRDERGYARVGFWFHPHAGESVRPFGWRGRTDDQNEFLGQLLKLVGAVSRRLRELKRQLERRCEAQEEAAPAATGMAISQPMIFICHASEDAAQGLDIHARLRRRGFRPWIDKKDLLPGEQWQQAIPRALRESDFILILLSSTSVAKRGYVQREFKLALEVVGELPSGTIRVIPVRLDDCSVPEELRQLQWSNLFEPEGFDRVVHAVHQQMQQRTISVPLDPTGRGDSEAGHLTFSHFYVGAFRAEVKLSALRKGARYLLALNGRAGGVGNDALRAVGRTWVTAGGASEGYLDFQRITPGPAGDFSGSTDRVRLPDGEYEAKFLVKRADADFPVVLRSDWLRFSVFAPA